MRPTRARGMLGGALLAITTVVVPAPLTAEPAPETCRSGPGWELSTDEFDPA